MLKKANILRVFVRDSFFSTVNFIFWENMKIKVLFNLNLVFGLGQIYLESWDYVSTSTVRLRDRSLLPPYQSDFCKNCKKCFHLKKNENLESCQYRNMNHDFLSEINFIFRGKRFTWLNPNRFLFTVSVLLLYKFFYPYKF